MLTAAQRAYDDWVLRGGMAGEDEAPAPIEPFLALRGWDNDGSAAARDATSDQTGGAQ